MAYIEFKEICKSYDGENQVLKSINLDVEKGELVTLLGPSGCGKSTLLRSLAGLEQISSGRIILDGEDITDVPVQKRGIGMVFQQYSLFQNMNVEDNILLPYYIKERTVNEKTCQLMNEYLTIMNLAGINKRDIHSLSGGEQQRVAIVRSILDSTKLILCDEPTASLDRKNTEIFMKALVDITQKRNVAVMIVTHDENVVKYGTAKYYMEDGKIRKYE